MDIKLAGSQAIQQLLQLDEAVEQKFLLSGLLLILVGLLSVLWEKKQAGKA